MTENQELELEYTFLARKLPEEIKGVQPKRLIDIYIPDLGDNHAHLRLRQKGDKREITKKVLVNEGDASTQIETSIMLDAGEFEALSGVSQKRVVKDRYFVTIGGFSAEVDVFREKLEGLVLIDFEFSSEAERAKFVKPAVCLADVTQEEFLAGGLISGKSYSDIANELAHFNYQPLA